MVSRSLSAEATDQVHSEAIAIVHGSKAELHAAEIHFFEDQFRFITRRLNWGPH
jgi:hypothetical protein